MRLVVTYDDGVWEFSVSSDADGDDYLDVFELTDLKEAQEAARDLMEEIAKSRDDPFDDLFDGEDEDG